MIASVYIDKHRRRGLSGLSGLPETLVFTERGEFSLSVDIPHGAGFEAITYSLGKIDVIKVTDKRFPTIAFSCINRFG